MTTDKIRSRSCGARIRWVWHVWRPRTPRAQRVALIAVDILFLFFFGTRLVPDKAVGDGMLALVFAVLVVAIPPIVALMRGLRREFRAIYAKPITLDEREFTQPMRQKGPRSPRR
jgi:hypothetical protein